MSRILHSLSKECVYSDPGMARTRTVRTMENNESVLCLYKACSEAEEDRNHSNNYTDYTS